MSEELLVNVTPMETRVALVDDGVLQDLYVERSNHLGAVGNIYCGKVVRVMPGMQAAFVDIGVERTSFIHSSDVAALGPDGMAKGEAVSPGAIHEVLYEGRKVIVQVTKDALGTKGPRVTTRLSVSSRYLVYLPHSPHIGISQRIEDEAERMRLRETMEGLRAQGALGDGGCIVRTAAESVGVEELTADLAFLRRLWAAVCRRVADATPPRRVYEDLRLLFRLIRDLVRPGVDRIRIDSREAHAALQQFCDEFVPDVKPRLELYEGERPLFELHGVEDEIQRALERRVELKSGGYLIIDQTEAMTTIDVNTGAYLGRSNQDETILKTNLEAAAALARQLRLRNLGGIIIVDFIDMRSLEHRRQVHRALERALAKDPAKYSMSEVSDLGLIEMTRKRTRESLEQLLCEECPACQGRGVLKSAETVCYEIFRDILRDARAYESQTLMVLAAQEVVDRLLDEESAHVADLEEFTGKTLRFRVEPAYGREQFDIVLL
jgi:ribonuclease G